MKMHHVFIIFCLALPSCSKGPHVDAYQIAVTKYACKYSPSIFRSDRNVAVCDTQEECNKVCATLPQQ